MFARTNATIIIAEATTNACRSVGKFFRATSSESPLVKTALVGSLGHYL